MSHEADRKRRASAVFDEARHLLGELKAQIDAANAVSASQPRDAARYLEGATKRARQIPALLKEAREALDRRADGLEHGR